MEIQDKGGNELIKKIKTFLIHLLGGYTSEEVQEQIQHSTKILQEDLI